MLKIFAARQSVALASVILLEEVEADYELEAGLYTLVLGGSSTSLIPEPRQGYEASVTSVSLER
ncbi:MAG: hypothetical protein ACO39V_01315, partial [Arenicellales bacterium]